jgi:hypothetical protein
LCHRRCRRELPVVLFDSQLDVLEIVPVLNLSSAGAPGRSTSDDDGVARAGGAVISRSPATTPPLVVPSEHLVGRLDGWHSHRRFHSDFGSIAAATALILAFGYAISWSFAWMGLATRDPESAQVASILPLFVLMFASNAVVPISTMPNWLQSFARAQPFSVTVTAVRELLPRLAIARLDGGDVCRLLGPRSAALPQQRLVRIRNLEDWDGR